MHDIAYRNPKIWLLVGLSIAAFRFRFHPEDSFQDFVFSKDRDAQIGWVCFILALLLLAMMVHEAWNGPTSVPFFGAAEPYDYSKAALKKKLGL